MVKNLKDLMKKFENEEKCREFLIQQRWGGNPECPKCGTLKPYTIENGKRFKCSNNKCYAKFTVTVGTVFQASNIPLSTWFPAMYLITAHKKGISSIQLAKDLGVTQKTAWFMLHRIRESLKSKNSSLLNNVVETDEVYIGGKVSNMSKTKRAALRTENGGTINNKIMVVGMLERGGDLKLVVSGKADNAANILPIMRENIHEDSFVLTDSSGNYATLGKEYAGHETVNHSGNEYVRNGVIHTNGIEGAFALLKRSIIGIYHNISPKHLIRYCDETSYRYNTRHLVDGQRFETSLTNITGRLSYKELIKKTDLSSDVLIAPDLPEMVFVRRRNERPVLQLKDGIVIAQFPSIREAEKVTGIKNQRISSVLKGHQRSTGGFQWKYV
ncbi:MAG: IS1595 family transposase [Ginsengibacter sp.]